MPFYWISQMPSKLAMVARYIYKELAGGFEAIRNREIHIFKYFFIHLTLSK